MNLNTFVENGFLQEANRQFFHPLGLALTAVLVDNAVTHLTVQDTDDPEGFAFNTVNPYKAAIVAEQARRIAINRTKALGWIVQPVKENT